MTVTATPEALKQLAKLPRVIRERIGKLFGRLESWPDVSGAKPLSGNLAGWFRLRTGDYRVRFRVEGEVIWSRKEKGRFPDITELKQLVRDRVAPDKSLGHSEKPRPG